jgi:hypothetical protein
VKLPNKPGKVDVQIAGTPVQYEWQSDSAQTISIRNSGGPEWAGKWAVGSMSTPPASIRMIHDNDKGAHAE